MVKHKRVPDSEEEEPAVKEEVGIREDAAHPPSKKSRPSSNSTEVEVKRNNEGKPYIELSDWRRLTISNYKGKTLVDIREYYKDKSSGEMKPGAKGISLTSEQWAKVKNNVDIVDQMMADAD